MWQSEKIERESQNDVTDEENGSEKDSTDGVRAFENEIADEDAETIIRSCGQQTPHLWPDSFPSYSAELYCENRSAYSNFNGEKTLIADDLGYNWTYHTEGKVLASGLLSGAVAICKFITE